MGARAILVVLLTMTSVWAQGPPNPWVRPNCLLGHQPAFVVNDDFTDTAFDSVTWVKESNAATASTDALVTVVETGGQLVVTPRASVSGLHYNGYRSVASYNLTDGGVAVEVPQTTANSAGVQTILSMGVDAGNYYEITFEGPDSLHMNAWVGGSSSPQAITYNATDHRWWQIRQVSSDNTARFETSQDGMTWTERRRVTNTFTMTSLRVSAEAGTWQAVTTPGAAVFDNLRIVANLTGYRWYLSATPGIVPNGVSCPSGGLCYILQQPAGTTSARCPQLSLVAGQTRYVVVTAVNPGGESLASNELWVIVSVGTVDVRP